MCDSCWRMVTIACSNVSCAHTYYCLQSLWTRVVRTTARSLTHHLPSFQHLVTTTDKHDMNDMNDVWCINMCLCSTQIAVVAELLRRTQAKIVLQVYVVVTDSGTLKVIQRAGKNFFSNDLFVMHTNFLAWKISFWSIFWSIFRHEFVLRDLLIFSFRSTYLTCDR